MSKTKVIPDITDIEITGTPGLEVSIFTDLGDRVDHISYNFTDKRTIKQNVHGGKDKKITRDFIDNIIIKELI